MSGEARRPILLSCNVVHDGTDRQQPLRDVALLVEDGRVARIAGGADGAQAPDAALRIEAPCVVPGLVNAHVHLEMSGEAQTAQVFVLTTPTQRALRCAENARKSLHAGVTAVRDLGSTENLAIDVRDAIDAGRIPGPRVMAAGQALCMTGGHGHFVGRETDGPWDARLGVREQRKAGADCIKLIATGGVLTKGAVPGVEQLTEEEMRAAIVEARTHGMRVAAHAIGTTGIHNALRAGVTSIEHGHLLDDEAIRLFTELGAYLVPTLAAITCIISGAPDAGSSVEDQPDWVLRKAREINERLQENLRKAYRAGVKFAGGSDSGTPFNHHENYWYEVVLMHELLGMPPSEALATATGRAAELLGIESGRLEVGRPADLLVLDRDPVDDLHALRTPRIVVKSGEIAVDRREPARAAG